MGQVTEIDWETTVAGINKASPIILAGEIEIDAAPEVVWEVLSTIEGWPTWNQEVTSASLGGQLAAGTVFRWKAGSSWITSKLVHVDPPNRIAWTGKTLGIKVIHAYRLEPSDGKTFVRTDESVEGIAARLFRRPLSRRMQSAIDVALRSMKTEAELRAAR